jgi:hypothetical protein
MAIISCTDHLVAGNDLTAFRDVDGGSAFFTDTDGTRANWVENRGSTMNVDIDNEPTQGIEAKR